MNINRSDSNSKSDSSSEIDKVWVPNKNPKISNISKL